MSKKSPSSWSDMHAFMKHAFYPLQVADTKPYKNEKQLIRDAESARAKRVSKDVYATFPDKPKRYYFGDLGYSELLNNFGVNMDQAKLMKQLPNIILNMFGQRSDETNSAQTTTYPTPGSYVGSGASAPAVSAYGNVQRSRWDLNHIDNLINSNISGSIYEDLNNKNNALSYFINQQNNRFNAEQADIQRAWETQMANSAHQREVQDLQAAGLNPVLSAGGSGAMTPTGASASSSGNASVSDSALQALANLAAVSVSANATMTAATTAANASMFGAQKSFDASKFASEMAFKGTQYSSDRTKYGAYYKLLETFLHEYVPGDHDYVENLFG